MRFKKIHISSALKSNEEVKYIIEKTKYRQFATDAEELDEHIFLEEQFLIKYKENPLGLIKMAIAYLKPNVLLQQ